MRMTTEPWFTWGMGRVTSWGGVEKEDIKSARFSVVVDMMKVG
jgi:hypothetical protein